jgi:hypothetical protein
MKIKRGMLPERPTILEMRQHVADLLERHEIIFTWECRNPMKAWAAPEAREVSIPAIKSAISYATALHEIGHILGRHQDSISTMVAERWAWRWAQKNALIWTSQMETNKIVSLQAAAVSLGKRQRRVAAKRRRATVLLESVRSLYLKPEKERPPWAIS